MQDADLVAPEVEPVPPPAEVPAVPADDFTPAQDVTEGVEKLQETAGDFYNALPNIAIAIAVVAAFVMLGWVIRWAVRKLNATRDRPIALALALGRLASGFCLILGLLVAAVIVFPNFTPTKVLELLGFGSVAIGFAFRDVLQNYLAGILLLFTQPFRIGDAIIVGSFEGVVQDIQTRATFIRTYDGRRVVIPNGELFTSSVTVNTAYQTRRVEYDLGIGYGDDIGEAKRILMGVMRDDPTVNDSPPPQVLVVELGGEAVMLRARWWIDPPQVRDLLESRDAVLQEAKQQLTEAGIDLPFPTQQILFHDQTEEYDGDRNRQREGWPRRTDDPDDTRRHGKRRPTRPD